MKINIEPDYHYHAFFTTWESETDKRRLLSRLDRTPGIIRSYEQGVPSQEGAEWPQLAEMGVFIRPRLLPILKEIVGSSYMVREPEKITFISHP